MAPYLRRPEVISLAGGVPDPATFPADEIVEAAAEELRRGAAEALQYGGTRGLPRLREAVARRLQGLGLAPSVDEVFITAGSQQGLDLVARLLLDPGDTVVVETPSYVGALGAFRAAGARLRALRSGGAEPDPSEVDRAVARARAEGSTARVLYLVPCFQNPAGTTLTAEARRALAAAAARNRLVVVEDDPYRELWFEAPPPPPVASLEAEAPVVYLGSFSKVLAPGLRAGFAVAPADLCERLERVKEAADLCTSTFGQAIVAALLERGWLERGVPRARALYRARRDAMLAALADGLGEGAAFTRPAGGFFTWVRLPGVSTEALLERALEAKVAFVTGAAFHAEGGGEDTLRLAYSREPEPRIAEGVGRLLRLLGRP